MSIFSRLFGAQAPAATALQDFLAKLTPEHAQSTYRSVKEKRLRLPAAISSMALFIVNKFVVGYSEMIRSTCKAAGTAAPPVPFDAIAFEAAAYVHYWLMREQLRLDDEDDDEDDNKADEDPFFTCLKEAAYVSDGLVQRYTSFPVPKKFFMNRVISYSANKAPSELFLRVLLLSQANGKPGPIRAPATPDLPVDLAAISYVGIFHNSYLEAIAKSAEGLYEADKAGLL